MQNGAHEIYEHDVLIIGAGGAGLRAAIEASQQGLSVGLVCKSLLGKAHTVMAEGGMAGSLGNVNEQDNWQVHFRDTMRGGKMLNNWRMVELFTREAAERILELERWGAVFDRTPAGKIAQRNFGGHRYPRLAHVGDRTGLEMIRTLQQHGVHQGIEVYMECTVVDLLLDGERAAGAFCYWRENGHFVVFRSKTVVLATGGLGKCYRVTSNSWEGTGDGLGLALRAGAALIDMEFIQFHPTGMVWPPSVRGILVTEGVRGEGGVLHNNQGQRFMFNYIPETYAAETASEEEEAKRWLKGDSQARRPPELLTRDVVAKAIRSEVISGRGSPHKGAFLNIASQRPPEYIRRKLPSMHHQFLKLANLDITKTPMEVGPTCHYAMGGILVDPTNTMTDIPGLFACGEVAGGLHGANRLGGNSLTDLVVFGQRSGYHASQYAKNLPDMPKLHDRQIKDLEKIALAPFENSGKENPYQLLLELQESMEFTSGIVRNAKDLKKGDQDLQKLKERTKKITLEGNRRYNPGWNYALDLRNLLLTSQAINLSALHRQESRGGHTREDFEASSPKFENLNTVVTLKKDQLSWKHVKREPMPDHLKKLL